MESIREKPEKFRHFLSMRFVLRAIVSTLIFPYLNPKDSMKIVDINRNLVGIAQSAERRKPVGAGISADQFSKGL